MSLVLDQLKLATVVSPVFTTCEACGEGIINLAGEWHTVVVPAGRSSISCGNTLVQFLHIPEPERIQKKLA